MKNSIAIIGALYIAINSPLGALAGDWYDHWDHNHDHNWSWHEWHDARRSWEREHRGERHLSDAELRAEFDRLDADHDHHLRREEAKSWGRW